MVVFYTSINRFEIMHGRLVKDLPPFYNRTGDLLEVYLADCEEAYADPLNKHVTIFRSMKTHEIVGCKVYGVSSVVEVAE